MTALALALLLSQVADDQPSDAPVAPVMTPADQVPQPLPTQPLADPKQTTRVWLSGGAGVLGSGASFLAMLGFAGLRSAMQPSGGSFDLLFGTAALGALLITGFELAVHQLLAGKGEAGLAVLAAIGVMAITGVAVGSAQLDPTTGGALVAGIGAIPAAVAVTAVLEATSSMGRRRSAW